MEIKPPKTCLLTVTNSCVLQCKMCRLWQLDTAADEISIEECKAFIDSLGKFQTEPIEVHLIGGETLIKKGILELIKYIRAKGSRTVITTSGYTIDEPMAQKLVDSGLSMLNISLDSSIASVHNYLRGKDDCFKRAMDAVGYLGKFKKDKLKLGINTVISAINLDSIMQLSEWVNNNQDLESLYFMAVMRPFGAPVDWQWQEKEEHGFLWPKDPNKVVSVIDGLIERKRRGYKIENPIGQLEDFKSYFLNPQEFVREHRCNLSHRAVNVNAIGDIYICFFMERLGNIRDTNIKEAWSSLKAQKVRHLMSGCSKNCELVINCYYGE